MNGIWTRGCFIKKVGKIIWTLIFGPFSGYVSLAKKESFGFISWPWKNEKDDESTLDWGGSRFHIPSSSGTPEWPDLAVKTKVLGCSLVQRSHDCHVGEISLHPGTNQPLGIDGVGSMGPCLFEIKQRVFPSTQNGPSLVPFLVGDWLPPGMHLHLVIALFFSHGCTKTLSGVFLRLNTLCTSISISISISICIHTNIHS